MIHLWKNSNLLVRVSEVAILHILADDGKTIDLLSSNKKTNAMQEDFEDTKGVIRIRISKDRQHNGRRKKDKQRYTKHTHNTKDRVDNVHEK
jgi:hypothetical protein